MVVNESEALRWVARQWQRLNGKDETLGDGDAWLSGWLAEISADLRETVAHQRCFMTMRYTNPRTFRWLQAEAEL